MIQSLFEPHVFPEPLFPFFFDRTNFSKHNSGPLNWHSNIELLYCNSGSGTVICDNRRLPISEGEIIVINSRLSHGVFSDEGIDYFYLIISDAFCEENGIFTNSITFTEHLKDPIISKAFLDVAEVIQNQAKYPTLTRYAIIRSKALQLLILLCNNYIDNSIKRDLIDSLTFKRIQNTMIYIQENFTTKLTLDDIASHIGVCKNHLSREFKKYTNITIVEYINFMRCRFAQMHILNGDSIAVAASVSGFDNLSYFSRTYKKYIGYLPSETTASK